MHPAVGGVADSPDRRIVLDAAIRWNTGFFRKAPVARMIGELPMSEEERSRSVLHLARISDPSFGHPLLAHLREPELIEVRAWIRDAVDASSRLSRRGHRGVDIAAALGDQPGIEEMMRLLSRLPADHPKRAREYLELRIRWGRARQSPDEMMSMIRSVESPINMDWALASALTMGVSPEGVADALEERKESMRADARARSTPRRSLIGVVEDNLSSIKQSAISAGILTPEDWPDVVSSDEHAHP